MRKGLLAVASVALVVGMFEVLLRIAWDNPYAGELPDRLAFIPVAHGRMDRDVDRGLIDPEIRFVPLRADDRGYVQPGIRHSDPDLTIAFLGGSTTANTTVQEELRFHALAARNLERGGLRVNALNPSLPGSSLHDSLNVFLNLVAFDEPDIVVVMHATNDIGLLKHPRGYQARESQPVSWRDQLRWASQQLSAQLSLGGVLRQVRFAFHPKLGPLPREAMEAKNDPALAKVPTGPFRARLVAFVQLCRAFGAEPVLMTQPLSSSRSALTPDWADLGNQDVFNAIIREVGREQDVLVIDLVSRLREIPGWDEPDRFFWDGMHVNDEGSRVVAGMISEALAPLALEITAAQGDR